MKLVLEITSHAGDGSIAHRSVESFPATLGRGYHNDIIIGDPHVCPEHVRIELGEDGKFAIRDLGSQNGLMVNKELHKEKLVALSSGDVVRIGRTTIRVFDPAHPVPPSQRLQRANPFLLWLSRPLTVWASFIIAIACTVGWRYLGTWRDEEIAETLGAAGFGAVIVTLIWAALWGVAGRLVRHKSRFRSHVALFSLFIIATIAADFITAYADFLTNGGMAATVLTYALNMAVCIGLLYGSLTLATEMTNKKRRAWCLFFAFGMTLAGIGFSQATKDRFEPTPSYASTLEPYLASLAPAESLETYMEGNKAVFTSDLFEKTDEK